ncbi:ribonuclease HII [Pseudoclavibacter chungangensis]|uniref:Ribonuclease n=1 Tax=Pseudoclavibacter chungangensis TaxID=587635 RepID=A0A7J5BYZ6_9MICO|nr:ribonuclease HII [Pseudoclavibacter chungangensis]KAB1659577.1 ribonuclease HII [Pseudoclavibacter chungangensis]NYJ67399.1 ribonuclease HII [Pseudoclavibacter chungangensis]
MTVAEPTLELERALLEVPGTDVVIGVDEVGRGALAGPVMVGACAVRRAQVEAGFPAGLRDSKLLSAKRREAIAPAVREWAFACGVGSATAREIDENGITACLALAATRALGVLFSLGVEVGGALVVLDGSHDWLGPSLRNPVRIMVRPKADRDCASVSGASVIAKVNRDGIMSGAHTTDETLEAYGWAANKGYGSAAHLAAIDRLGPSAWHRRTWLHGRGDDVAAPAGPPANA